MLLFEDAADTGGEQVRVPISGSHARRVLHGAINIRSGDVLLLITDIWDEHTHRYFMKMLRSHWRGWHIILFEDHGTPHTEEDTLMLADELKIEIRLLPTATPKMNAMGHLWKSVKRRALANRPTENIDISADDACHHIIGMSRHQRLKAAGVLSENFWLAEYSGS
nr:transposase [Desulfonema magnum]